MPIVPKWSPSPKQAERDARADELLDVVYQFAPYEALELRQEIEALRQERKEACTALHEQDLPLDV
jgi:hypothetical protein